MLTLKDRTVTIDAMGYQRSICEKVLEKGADYILQVKNNQKGLLEQIEMVFEITKPFSTHTEYNTVELGT